MTICDAIEDILARFIADPIPQGLLAELEAYVEFEKIASYQEGERDA